MREFVMIFGVFFGKSSCFGGPEAKAVIWLVSLEVSRRCHL
jgi:hypothetical protein